MAGGTRAPPGSTVATPLAMIPCGVEVMIVVS